MTYTVTVLVALLPWIFAIVAFALPLTWLLFRKKTLIDALFLCSLFLGFIVSLTLIMYSISEKEILIYPFGGWPPLLGIIYYVDLFGVLLVFLSTTIMLLIGIYASWYIAVGGFSNRDRVLFYVLLLGLTAGLVGCFKTGDLFNLFVMIEVVAISAYSLVAFHRERGEAIEAAIKYSILGALATTLYFIAVVTIYASYGSLTMADIVMKSRDVEYSTVFTKTYGNIAIASALAIALALWAFTFKSALAPNHFWLIDAHPEAPAPVSAALSGLIVNIGVYASARLLLTIFGEDSVVDSSGILAFTGLVLLILGTLSAILGSLMMAVQRDSKRLLAYSTVSHIGLMYMALGLAVLSEGEAKILSVTALLLHIITHCLGKTLLFLCVGVAEKMRGSRDLDLISGCGIEYPTLGFSVTIGSLSLLGVPLTAGFYSKLLMYQAFIKAGYEFFAVMVIVASAISAMGYFKLTRSTLSFYTKTSNSRNNNVYNDLRVAIPLLLLTLSILLLPLLLPLGLEEILDEASQRFIDYERYAIAFEKYLEDYIEMIRGTR